MHSITTVIATSSIPSHPSIKHIRRTIESLQLVEELWKSPVLIAFDGKPKGQAWPNYELYCSNVERFVRKWSHVKLVHLGNWGNLTGVMSAAVNEVETPFMLVQQHDFPLIRKFDLQRALHLLENDELVKHIRLNKRENFPVGWDAKLFRAYRNPFLPVIKTGCWSDNTHLTTAEYYRETILPEVKNSNSYMEKIINPQFRLASGVELEATHRKYGTFIYGKPGDPPIIEHSDGRGN